jgi:hypothetical protein
VPLHEPTSVKSTAASSDAAAPGTDAAASPRNDVQPATAAPAPTTSVAAAVPRSPRDQCGGRHLVALHRCMVRECQKPEFSAHRDCQRVRDIEASARNLGAN